MSPSATLRLFALALFAALLLPFLAAPASAQTTFTAQLSGAQEVPANPSAASGAVSAELTGTTLVVTGAFSGLESDYDADIGAHLHLGFAGENGPVEVALAPDLDGDLRGGTFSAEDNTFELSGDQAAALRERRLYVNVHTERYPAGEVRGQLLAADASAFLAVLAGSNEVPSNPSRARGGVTAELDGNSLVVTGAFSGLESDYNTDIGSHLHLGFAGQNGPVILPLAPALDDDLRGGVFRAEDNTFALDGNQIAHLEGRRLYVNIHTRDLPGGELRGQLLAADATPFVAGLASDNEVPARLTGARGGVNAELTGEQLVVTGAFSGLESDYFVVPGTGSGAHLHLGLAGENGPVALSLTAALDGDARGGVFRAEDNTFALDGDQIAALLERRLYVNVHSERLPAGELRGQMVLGGAVLLRAPLSGRAQVPANGSQAVGAALVEIRGTDAVVTGAFSRLESDFDDDIGAHIHIGGLGENGDVVFPLEREVSDDGRAGTFPAEGNRFELSDEVVDAMIAGGYYVNVHTDDLQAGEVRGQVLPLHHRVFEAWIVGGNQVPSVDSPGSGAVIAVLDRSELTVAGAFQDLSSDFDPDIGAHIHLGAADENGPVVFAFEVDLDEDRRGGTFPAADNVFTLDGNQVQALYDARYYVNVHTEDLPAGEIRGQVLISTNVAPDAPEITAPGDGATVALEGDPDAPLVAAWDAADPNGNPVFSVWELAADPDFEALVLTDSTGTSGEFSSTFGDVDALLAGLGVGEGESITVYHRATVTDGSFSRMGPSAAVTLRRGMFVSTEPGTGALSFSLSGAAPNPFTATTTLRVDLPEAADVTVTVYDVLGRRILQQQAGALSAGPGRQVRVDGSALAAGTYLVRIEAVGASQTYSATSRAVRVR